MVRNCRISNEEEITHLSLFVFPAWVGPGGRAGAAVSEHLLRSPRWEEDGDQVSLLTLLTWDTWRLTLHGPGRAAQRVSGHHGPRICLSGHHLVSHQAEAPVCLCFWYALQNAFAVVACFSAVGILFQLSGTLCEKKFFLTSRRGAGIRRFSGSAVALVTLSISLAILNHVSLFTLSLPTRILWTCCMSSWCLHEVLPTLGKFFLPHKLTQFGRRFTRLRRTKMVYILCSGNKFH